MEALKDRPNTLVIAVVGERCATLAPSATVPENCLSGERSLPSERPPTFTSRSGNRQNPSGVAKVLKPTGSVKSAATVWLRETDIHSKLSAGRLPTIVQLLCLDARAHSLYLEDIGAPSFAQRGWRGPGDYFAGTPADAHRILNDIATALTVVHKNGVANNDIKPGNTLFRAVRVAALYRLRAE
ncbi:hypothetical protein VTI74DRAFT_4589 [Chaetomium olivicolor]